MEPLKKIKGQTSKRKEPFQSKYAASIGKVCERCRGICIFSKAFIEKYSKSGDLRKKLDETFFRNEFQLLRTYQAENEDKEDHKVISKFSENSEEEIDFSAFDLVKLFHSLDCSQQKEIMKMHCAGSEHMVYFTHFNTRINKHDKLVRPIPTKDDYSYSDAHIHRMTRQQKKSSLISANICDKTME